MRLLYTSSFSLFLSLIIQVLYIAAVARIYIYIYSTDYVCITCINMWRCACMQSIGNIGIYEPRRQHVYTTLSILAQRGLSIHCVCLFKIFLHYPYVTPLSILVFYSFNYQKKTYSVIRKLL